MPAVPARIGKLEFVHLMDLFGRRASARQWPETLTIVLSEYVEEPIIPMPMVPTDSEVVELLGALVVRMLLVIVIDKSNVILTVNGSSATAIGSPYADRRS